MNELRKDYLLDRWAIIAAERAKRPMDFISKKREYPSGVCYFCPGNEHTTPPEIGRLKKNGGWNVRWFPNKFPATTDQKADLSRGLLTSKSAYGLHEVIVETPVHEQEFEDLGVEEMASVFDVCSGRISELLKMEDIKYVLVFKNRGRDAGASLSHSHFQVIALPQTPTLVAEESAASQKHMDEKGRCLFCDVIAEESRAERKIHEDEDSIAFAPYASRFPFEAWIAPKRHVRSFGELTHVEKHSFALATKKVLQALDKMLETPPYNFYMHVSPQDGNLHFHMEVCPKLSIQAGFELGSSMYINVVPPEDAAKHYKSNI